MTRTQGLGCGMLLWLLQTVIGLTSFGFYFSWGFPHFDVALLWTQLLASYGRKLTSTRLG
jgi:hypothetical protein